MANWMARMPRWYSLQGRIALAFVLLMVLTQGGGTLLLRTVGESAARDNVRAEMRTADRVAADVMKTRNAQLSQSASVLAADFGFKAAMATGDHETIVSALENNARRIQADVALLLDTDGVPQVSFPEIDAKTLTNIRHDMQRHQRSANGIAVLNVADRLYQVVEVPVRAPELIGSVMLGFELDQSVLSNIKDMTGTQVSLLERDAQHGPLQRASTFPSSLARELVQALPAGANPTRSEKEVLIDGDRYLASETRLGTEIGNRHDVALVLNRSVDQALAPFRGLLHTLFAYSVLMLALATVLSFLIARSVTAPLRGLGQFARRLAAGHYDPLPQVNRRDEIGDLSRAFEHMREGIATREQHIRQLAYHDQLTGLSNRTQLQDAIEAAIASAPQRILAVYLLDLDRFKFINEVLGHPVGDCVLQEVGTRLKTLENYGACCVARLGGDEFALVVPVDNSDHAVANGEHLLQLLHVPIVIDEAEVDACASIGIALYPAHGSDALSLLRCADMAMYQAKDNKSEIVIFDPSLARTNSSALSLRSELRRAVENGELVLNFQPKLDLSGKGKRAVEALVRWNHPTRGFVPPMNFIPFAEQTGLIRNITAWVLRSSMEVVVDWHSRGLAVQVAVNLSARDLVRPELPGELRALLTEMHCEGAWILLEVTESAFASDMEQVSRNLNAMREMGCDIAIDDFGSEYSSLQYLEKLPVTEIKIDKGFVLNMLKSHSDEVIVSSTIGMAHRMGLRVTAEGVDSLEALQRLQTFGCDMAQGYFLSRPVPAPVVEAWYRDGCDRHHVRSRLVTVAAGTDGTPPKGDPVIALANYS
jgi:diguanylate cyclase (GGDEF)-like protein